MSFPVIVWDVADAGGVESELRLVGAPSQVERSSSADAVAALVGVVVATVAGAAVVMVVDVVAVEVAAVVVVVDTGIARKVFGVVGNTFHCAVVAVENTSW